MFTQTMNGATVTLDHGHNRSHQLTDIAANDDIYLVRPATLTSRAYAPNARNEYGSFAGSPVTNDLNGNLLGCYQHRHDLKD